MPVTQELLDKISEYEKQGYGPDEIVQGLSQSQNFSDVAKKAKEYAAKGYGPDEILQGMKSSPVAERELSQMTPEELNALPPYTSKVKITGMGAPGEVTEPMPRWRQEAVMAARKLPEIGQATGTALGMAGTVSSAGTSPWLIPAGGGTGRMLGRALQTPLEKLLLPKADIQYPSSGEIVKQGMTGATGGAIDAMIPVLAGKFLGKTPSQGLDTLIEGTNPINAVKGATRTIVGKMPQKIQSKLLKVPYSDAPNPVEESKIIDMTLKRGIEPTEAGYHQIEQKVSDLSGSIDEIIQSATDANGLVSVGKVRDNLQGLRTQYANSDMPGYVKALDDYMEGFKNMHPEDFMPIQEAHDLKKFIYATNKDYYGYNTYDPVIESRKKIGEGLRQEIEQASGDPHLAELNKELGDYLSIRGTVGRATGRIGRRNPIGLPAEIGINMAAHGTPGAITGGTVMAAANNPYIMSKVARGLYGAQQWAGKTPIAKTPIENIGSPYKYIEDLLGIKNFPYKTETPKQLIAPQSKLPEPQGKLPAPAGYTGGNTKDYMYAIPENPSGTPRSAIQESQDIVNGLYDRTNPTLYAPSTGPSFSGANVPFEMGPNEPLKSMTQGATSSSQKLLPAPAIQGTPSGVAVTPENAGVLYNAPQDEYSLLKELLRMKSKQ